MIEGATIAGDLAAGARPLWVADLGGLVDSGKAPGKRPEGIDPGVRLHYTRGDIRGATAEVC